jgi:hypothetical protein
VVRVQLAALLSNYLQYTALLDAKLKISSADITDSLQGTQKSSPSFEALQLFANLAEEENARTLECQMELHAMRDEFLNFGNVEVKALEELFRVVAKQLKLVKKSEKKEDFEEVNKT